MPVRTAYAGAAVSGEVLTAANVNKMPGGWIGYAEATADQAGITAEVDLTGLTVTVTVGASRRIRITGDLYVQNNTAAGLTVGYIYEGATLLQKRSVSPPSANISEDLSVAIVLTPTAGVHTYRLRLAAGGGSATLEAASTFPSTILVEDIGPAT